jgi:hypothetical protein
MRGLAIVLMTEAHIGISLNFLNLQLYSNILAAPFFIITAGIGFQLFIQSRLRKKLENNIIFLETLWRSIILFILSTGLFIIGIRLFPSSFQDQGILKWNVFQVISVGYLIGYFIRDSINKKILIILSLFIISSLISVFQVNTLYALSKGLFPLIPWLSYFILGQLIYEMYEKKNLSLTKNKKIIGFSTIFLILNIVIMYITPYNFTYANRDAFPEFLMISSIFILVIIVLIRIVDIKQKLKMVLSPIENIGKIAFTAYYIQMIIIFVVLSKNNIFNILPSTISNVSILALTIVILVLLERIWRNKNYKLGVEWILRAGTNFFVKLTLKITDKIKTKN